MIDSNRSFFKILQAEGIINTSNIPQIVSLLRDKYKFPVITSGSLSLDSEQRTYKEEITFRDSIIDVDNLVIANSVSIRFYNCIIRGKIVIQDKASNCHLKTIVVDTCLLRGDFIITGVSNIDSISIYNTQFQRMSWMGLEGDTINLVKSNIKSFEIENAKLKTLHASQNTIEYLLVSESVFLDIDFDHNQIVLNKLLKSFRQEYRSSILKKIWHCCLFRITRPTKLAIELAFDEESIRHRFRVINNTLCFLKKYSNINRNRKRKSDVLFFEAIFHQNNWIIKFFIWICGGFVSPGRIIFNGVFIWFIFAIIYYKVGLLFKINNVIHPLNFLNSLYFSGITFITLSYGDIVPIGTSKVLVVVEGALGVIALSCIVISLVRRFIGES